MFAIGFQQVLGGLISTLAKNGTYSLKFSKMGEGRLAKPQLRDLHLSQSGRNLVVALAISAAVGIAYKVLVCDSYEKKVENFYKNYDPMAALKVMNEAGLMQSYRKD